MQSATFVSLRMEVERVLDGDVIALRQRSEAVHTLHGMYGGEIETGRAAGGFDAHVRGNTVVVDVEDHCRTFTQRGGGIGLGGVPVLRDLAVDDVHVIREARTEGTVLDRDTGRPVFYLQRGLRHTNPGCLARNRLVGLGRKRLNMFRRLGSCFFGCLDGLGDLVRNGQLFRIRRRNGLLFCDDRCGARRLGCQDASVQSALRGRQRKRRDHGGLDGAGVGRVLAPGYSMGVEEERPSNDDPGNKAVQQKRAGEVAAEVIAGKVVVPTELEVSGYGRLLTFESAG
jgi:hypothetical protein